MNKQNLSLIIQSFLPLIAFYTCEHFWGLKVAIAATVVVTVLEIIYRKVKKQTLDGFFWFIAGTTILFGLIDVYSSNTSFFKYEPALTNFVTALYFAWGAWKPVPLILEFAQKANKAPKEPKPDLILYMRAMTWIWVVYMLIKAIAYLWIAGQPETSTSSMMIIRTVVGNVSLFVMLGISWGLGKPMFKWVQKRIQKTNAIDPNSI